MDSKSFISSYWRWREVIILCLHFLQLCLCFDSNDTKCCQILSHPHLYKREVGIYHVIHMQLAGLADQIPCWLFLNDCTEKMWIFASGTSDRPAELAWQERCCWTAKWSTSGVTLHLSSMDFLICVSVLVGISDVRLTQSSERCCINLLGKGMRASGRRWESFIEEHTAHGINSIHSPRLYLNGPTSFLTPWLLHICSLKSHGHVASSTL